LIDSMRSLTNGNAAPSSFQNPNDATSFVRNVRGIFTATPSHVGDVRKNLEVSPRNLDEVSYDVMDVSHDVDEVWHDDVDV
jgi:hypothetical protein